MQNSGNGDDEPYINEFHSCQDDMVGYIGLIIHVGDAMVNQNE